MPGAELRSKLVAGAEGLVDEVTNSSTPAADRAHLAAGTRDLLTAAEKVEAAVSPAEIDAALARLGQELVDADLMKAYSSAESVEDFLREVFRAIVTQRERIMFASAIEVGYESLGDLLANLHRDFSASDTPTAQRIAARIQNGLDEASKRVVDAQRLARGSTAV